MGDGIRTITGGRQMGKTHEMLRRVAEHGSGAVISVASQDQAMLLWDLIKRDDLPIAQDQIVVAGVSRDEPRPRG